MLVVLCAGTGGVIWLTPKSYTPEEAIACAHGALEAKAYLRYFENVFPETPGAVLGPVGLTREELVRFLELIRITRPVGPSGKLVSLPGCLIRFTTATEELAVNVNAKYEKESGIWTPEEYGYFRKKRGASDWDHHDFALMHHSSSRAMAYLEAVMKSKEASKESEAVD
jgi:hypothetical protein